MTGLIENDTWGSRDFQLCIDINISLLSQESKEYWFAGKNFRKDVIHNVK